MRILFLLSLVFFALPSSSFAAHPQAVFADCGKDGEGFWSFWNGDVLEDDQGQSLEVLVSDHDSWRDFRARASGILLDLDLGESPPGHIDPIRLPLGFVSSRFAEMHANFLSCLDRFVAGDDISPGGPLLREGTEDSGLLSTGASQTGLLPPSPDPLTAAQLLLAYQRLLLGSVDTQGRPIPGLCEVTQELTDFSGWTRQASTYFIQSCQTRAQEMADIAQLSLQTRIYSFYLADRFYTLEWWLEWLGIVMRQTASDIALIKNHITNLDFVLPGKFVKIKPEALSNLSQCGS